MLIYLSGEYSYKAYLSSVSGKKSSLSSTPSDVWARENETRPCCSGRTSRNGLNFTERSVGFLGAMGVSNPWGTAIGGAGKSTRSEQTYGQISAGNFREKTGAVNAGLAMTTRGDTPKATLEQEYLL